MSQDPTHFYVSTVRRRRQRRQPPQIRDPQAVYRLVHPLVYRADREHFYCVYLTSRHTVLRVELVSVGSLNASVVHPREVFKAAISMSAAAVILVHNHPSGDPSPSDDDQKITHRIAKAGEILGIPLLDHVVVGNGDLVSLRERGLLPPS